MVPVRYTLLDVPTLAAASASSAGLTADEAQSAISAQYTNIRIEVRRLAIFAGSALALVTTAPASEAQAQSFVMARQNTGTPAVVYTVNQPAGRERTEARSRAMGGSWAWLLMGDRCPGWVGIWSASQRLGGGAWRNHYVVERGAQTAHEASQRAEARARAMAGKSPDWVVSYIRAFQNDNTAAGTPESLRGYSDELTEDPCSLPREGVPVGVRG